MFYQLKKMTPEILSPQTTLPTTSILELHRRVTLEKTVQFEMMNCSQQLIKITVYGKYQC